MSNIVSYLLKQKGTNLMEGANKSSRPTWRVEEDGKPKRRRDSNWLEERCSISLSTTMAPYIPE